MHKVLNIYKPIGTTPYQIVKKLKEERAEYAESTISYAGRLDPMAEGVLILLVDEENQNREKYQGLDKEYVFEVLFGLETDTYDLLGIVKNSNASHKIPNSKSQAQNKSQTPNPKSQKSLCLELGAWCLDFICHLVFEICNFTRRSTSDIPKNPKQIEAQAISFVENLIGRRVQKYPPYSSYTIKGKPLFQWAKEGKIDEIELPEKDIIIYESEYLGKRTITAEELHQTIIERVSKVEGKFRQEEILKRWRMFFKNLKGPNSPKPGLSEFNPGLSLSTPSFPILKFRIVCSSGTYVRQIAHKLGKITRTGALCFHIKRTRVGEYILKNSLHL